MKFPKPAKTFEEQLAILKGRGLAIPSDDEALRWLKRVNYYRLSAYFAPFKQPSPSDDFIAGANFDRIVDLYVFDCRLRNLFMQAMERIEVSVRTAITYELAHTYGPFAHTDPNTFSSWFLQPMKLGHLPPFNELVENIVKEEKRTKEVFIKAYREKYTSEKHLPIWMATELMSFGTLSLMFEGLKSVTKTKIAGQYKLAEKPFQNWLHVLSSIRNMTAHHSRLWNRTLGVQAVIPHGWIHQIPKPDRTYCVAVMMQHLLSMIARGCSWRKRFILLVDLHPNVQLAAMGFPDDWKARTPWT
jgi:abortive infection bacteriophage resistance protein